KGSLKRVFVFGEAQFAVNDQLDCHGSAHRLFGRRGNGLVVGIGMQRIAVVVNGIQRLQGGTNVVEVDFLCMQGAAGGLNVILQLLGTIVAFVFVFQCFGPNATRHASNDSVFRVNPVRKEKGEIGS